MPSVLRMFPSTRPAQRPCESRSAIAKTGGSSLPGVVLLADGRVTAVVVNGLGDVDDVITAIFVALTTS